VRYRGVAYFSPPLATNPTRPDTGLKLLVFDTSSVIRPRTRSRTLVVSRPDAIGSRTVIDWFVISNPLERTRVSRDSLDPTWSAVLPAEAVNAQVGDARINQFSPDAVGFRGDSVHLFAAVSPGEKELLLQYEIPAGHRRIELPVAGADSVDVFLEEPNAELDPAAGWTVTTQTFEGRGFRRFARAAAGAGRVAIRFPGLALQPGAVLPWRVGAFGLALALLSWRLLARPDATPAAPSRIDGLVERLAALEGRYRGREAELTPEQWEAYRRERAELVAALDAALVAARSRT
jgi:hypothetical protein